MPSEVRSTVPPPGSGPASCREANVWRPYACATCLLAAIVAMVSVPAITAERYGYTWSLLIWLAPALLFAGALRRQTRGMPGACGMWTAIACTVALTTTYITAVETCLAQYAFWFPNREAVLGFYLPHFQLGRWQFDPVRAYPFEELLFYVVAVLAILLIYLWTDVQASGVATRSDTTVDKRRCHHVPGRMACAQFAGVVAWLLAIALRSHWNSIPTAGLPLQSGLILVLGIAPIIAMYPSVRKLVNWKAMGFTLAMVLPLSVFYEALLGLPRGWWAYHAQATLGIYLDQRRLVPLEAAVVWVAGVFFTVFILERFRLRLGNGGGHLCLTRRKRFW